MKKEWSTKTKVTSDNRSGVLIDGEEVVSEGAIDTTDAEGPASEEDQKTYGKNGKLKRERKKLLPPNLKA